MLTSALLLAGCGTTVVTVTSHPAPISYEPLDFDKWTSNMYGSDFNGRWFVGDLYFLMPLTHVQGMAWYDFAASKDSAQRLSDSAAKNPSAASSLAVLNNVGKSVMVRAPMTMRDMLSRFNMGRAFRVYGQAQLKGDGGLFLVAEKIELTSE